MRFGVIGLGSMGKRRVRDLSAMGHDVVGFDERADRRAEAADRFGCRTVERFESLIEARPDALVVSTPPDRHVGYYEKSFDARLPFFSEANILTPTVRWFREREGESGVRGYASATWRFYPLFALLRDQLGEAGAGAVNTVHYHYGGYLPLWHPWETYSQFYAGSRKAVSAAREMVPFEMEWLCWVFGSVRAVAAVNDRRSTWSTDIDDTYLLLLEFESGLRGTLNVELHQVAPFRVGRIACRGRSFFLDMAAHEMRRYDLATDTWKVIKPPGLRAFGSFDFEQTYWAEMRAFVDALEGRAAYPKSWEDDRHLSNVLFAAEESFRRRAWVRISEVESVYDGQSCEVPA